MSYLTLGLILLIGGFVISIISFSVAASNMGKSMSSPQSTVHRGWGKSAISRSGSFRRHSLMMVPMALGGMTSFVGLVFIALHIVEKVTT